MKSMKLILSLICSVAASKLIGSEVAPAAPIMAGSAQLILRKACEQFSTKDNSDVYLNEEYQEMLSEELCNTVSTLTGIHRTEQLLMLGANVNRKTTVGLLSGRRPIAWSCFSPVRSSVPHLKLLLQHKADPNVLLENGDRTETPLIRLARRATAKNAPCDIAELLLEHRADPCAIDGGNQLRTEITRADFPNALLRHIIEGALLEKEEEKKNTQKKEVRL